MTKKGMGVKEMELCWKKHLSALFKIEKNNLWTWHQTQSSNADHGNSSQMTSVPQHELSEGFENVNFKKRNKTKLNKKYIKKKSTIFLLVTGKCVMMSMCWTLREPLGLNGTAPVFLSCEWHSIYGVIFHVQFLICWFVWLVTGYALGNSQPPISSLSHRSGCALIDPKWIVLFKKQAVTVFEFDCWLDFCSAGPTQLITIHSFSYVDRLQSIRWKIWLLSSVSEEQKSPFQRKFLSSFCQTLITW